MADQDLLDVLIIGAGFSGLSAARELDGLGASFRVVDSFSDHLGGRAYAYTYKPGLAFDHGAEYLGDLQNGIMKLVHDLLPADELVNGPKLRHDAPQEVMYLANHRFSFNKANAALGIQGIPPDIGFLALAGIIGLLAEMTLVEIAIDVVKPWTSPSWATELDKISVEDWVKKKHWVNERARDILRISVEALLSVEPSEISPFYLLWYTACNDGLLNEVNDDAGGPQQYWLKRGMSSLADAFATPIRDRIDQGVRVTRVDHGGDVVRVETDGGRTYRAKKVIVATSPHSAGRIQFTPAPPAERQALFDLPMGRTIKCQLFYDTRWWYDSKGLKYDGYVGGSDYPICWVMDNSPPDAGDTGPFVLMTFTVGEQVDKLGPNPSDAEIEKLVVDSLTFLFDDERAKTKNRIVIHRWVPSESHVGGGPNTIFTPGVLTGPSGKLLDEPWGDKIFFAASENARNLSPRSTSTKWNLFAKENLPKYDPTGALLPTSKAPFTSRYSDMRRSLGYMDGALESGRYGAHAVATSLGFANAIAAPVHVAAEHAPAPPAVAPIAPEHATSVLNALHDELHGAAPVTGLQGATSHLREAIVRAMKREGRLAADADHAAEHVAVRDFAASIAAHAAADPSAHPEAAHPHFASIRAAVGKLEARVVSLFKK